MSDATPDSPDIAGAICTSVVSGDGRWEVIQYGGNWCVYDHVDMGRRVQTYPDSPGMNALVALRRWLVEWAETNREKHQ